MEDLVDPPASPSSPRARLTARIKANWRALALTGVLAALVLPRTDSFFKNQFQQAVSAGETNTVQWFLFFSPGLARRVYFIPYPATIMEVALQERQYDTARLLEEVGADPKNCIKQESFGRYDVPGLVSPNPVTILYDQMDKLTGKPIGTGTTSFSFAPYAMSNPHDKPLLAGWDERRAGIIGHGPPAYRAAFAAAGNPQDFINALTYCQQHAVDLIEAREVGGLFIPALAPEQTFTSENVETIRTLLEDQFAQLMETPMTGSTRFEFDPNDNKKRPPPQMLWWEIVRNAAPPEKEKIITIFRDAGVDTDNISKPTDIVVHPYHSFQMGLFKSRR